MSVAINQSVIISISYGYVLLTANSATIPIIILFFYLFFISLFISVVLVYRGHRTRARNHIQYITSVYVVLCMYMYFDKADATAND